jgi:hypothetical protein
VKEGERVFRLMCNSFDSSGNVVPPVKTYETLTQDEKIALLEWREDTLCEEFAEESRVFEEVMAPLRPHNDKRFRYNKDKTLLMCPTFYDGCNCKPDHTQEDWNNLKADHLRLMKKRDNAEKFLAEAMNENKALQYEIQRLEGQHGKSH